MSLLAALTYFITIACVSGALREYDVIISRGIISPDGFHRVGYFVNGEFPGPTLEAVEGDQMIVRMRNLELPHEAIVLHFHGIHQNGTQWHDGAAYVTSCPIVFGSTFVHNFTVPHAGTFWYHSHVGSSRMEGSYGMLIVRPAEESDPKPFEYDEELSIILSDWYHSSAGEIEIGLTNNDFKWPGNGDAILVNGKGDCVECPYVYPSQQATSGQTCTGKRENFLVEPGKTYLLRILNAASLAYYNLAIAGHNLTVVGADASYTDQSVQKSVDVGPGQRLSVLVTTNQHTAPLESNSELHTYLMRVQSEWRGNDTSPAGIGYAHWTYATANTISAAEANGNVDSTINEDVADIVPPNESRDWDEWNSILNAKNSQSIGESDDSSCPPNSAVTNTVVLTVQQQYVSTRYGSGLSPPLNSSGVDGTVLGWTLYNNSREISSSTPHLLERYFDYTVDGQENYDNDGTPPIRLELGSVVDIVIQNSVAMNGVCEQHPWHLHGYDFFVVGQGDGAYSPASSMASYNTINPPQVDTIVAQPSSYGNRREGGDVELGEWMEPCGWMTLRFTANNPGMWLFHCHIDWHLVMGMAVVFDVASETVGRYPDDYPLCGSAVQRSAVEEATCLSDLEKANRGNNDDNDDSSGMSTASLVAVCVIATVVVVLGCAIVLSYLLDYRLVRRVQGAGGGSAEEVALASAMEMKEAGGSSSSRVGNPAGSV